MAHMLSHLSKRVSCIEFRGWQGVTLIHMTSQVCNICSGRLLVRPRIKRCNHLSQVCNSVAVCAFATPKWAMEVMSLDAAVEAWNVDGSSDAQAESGSWLRDAEEATGRKHRRCSFEECSNKAAHVCIRGRAASLHQYAERATPRAMKAECRAPVLVFERTLKLQNPFTGELQQQQEREILRTKPDAALRLLHHQNVVFLTAASQGATADEALCRFQTLAPDAEDILRVILESSGTSQTCSASVQPAAAAPTDI